jgi:hypothetical protein
MRPLNLSLLGALPLAPSAPWRSPILRALRVCGPSLPPPPKCSGMFHSPFRAEQSHLPFWQSHPRSSWLLVYLATWRLPPAYPRQTPPKRAKPRHLLRRRKTNPPPTTPNPAKARQTTPSSKNCGTKPPAFLAVPPAQRHAAPHGATTPRAGAKRTQRRDPPQAAPPGSSSVVHVRIAATAPA